MQGALHDEAQATPPGCLMFASRTCAETDDPLTLTAQATSLSR